MIDDRIKLNTIFNKYNWKYKTFLINYIIVHQVPLTMELIDEHIDKELT